MLGVLRTLDVLKVIMRVKALTRVAGSLVLVLVLFCLAAHCMLDGLRSVILFEFLARHVLSLLSYARLSPGSKRQYVNSGTGTGIPVRGGLHT